MVTEPLNKLIEFLTSLKGKIERSRIVLVRKQRDAICEKKYLNYKENLKPNQKFKIIFGGHWESNSEWLILNEKDQDITQPLKFQNDTVDVVFTEHVIEHISFNDTIYFMKESK